MKPLKTYFDYNATAPLDLKVQEILLSHLKSWGNPSSIHWAGQEAKAPLRQARQNISNFLNVSALELIFTSGGSESNNTILQMLSHLNLSQDLPESLKGRNEIILSQVEHPSLVKCAEELERQGQLIVHWVPVFKTGIFDLDFYKSKLSSKTLLVSVMMANNETGHIFPIKEIAKLAKSAGALVHSDLVQALGKIPFSIEELQLDYASFAIHKIGGLKGTGLLYVRKNSPFQSLIWGGRQERRRRGGTENSLGQIAAGKAFSILDEKLNQMNLIREYRDKIENDLVKLLPEVRIFGASHPRLPNTTLLTLTGVDGESLLMALDLAGFAVSTGAACSSGNPEPSPVLLRMGYSKVEAQSSLRISLGWETQKSDVERFIKEVVAIVNRVRSFSVKPETNLNFEVVL